MQQPAVNDRVRVNHLRPGYGFCLEFGTVVEVIRHAHTGEMWYQVRLDLKENEPRHHAGQVHLKPGIYVRKALP